MDEKTYNINEVATAMGMSLKAVRRFVASGELKTSKRNNTYSITEQALDDFKRYLRGGNIISMLRK